MRIARSKRPQRVDREATVRVGPAEAPGPRAGIATPYRGIEHLRHVQSDRGGIRRMLHCGVAGELTQQHRLRESECLRRRHHRIEIAPWMSRVWIRMNLQHVEPQLSVLPRPQIMQAGALS